MEKLGFFDMSENNRLKTIFAKLELDSPIIVASSGLTENVERMAKCQQFGAGAVIIKSFFEEEISRESPTPRFYIINHGKGIEKSFTFMSYEQASKWDIRRYAEEVSRAKKELSIKIIPSINCLTLKGWSESAKMLESAGADAIEINTSCPHGSITFRGDAVEATISRTVELVRKAVKIPLIAKISPMLTSPPSLAIKLEETGVDALTIFNRMTALEIDIESESPVMHKGYAGHGGPWAIQYPLRWISEIRPQVKIDIAASGGVWNWMDAVKYFLVGANVVQVCTAIYINGFEVIRELNAGIKQHLDNKNYRGVSDFRGKVNSQILGTKDIDRRKKFKASISLRKDAPCKSACPADVPAQAYVNLIAERKFKEAVDVIYSCNPFQSICGRACYHPCEDECARGLYDEPIKIRALKRFVLDWAKQNSYKPEFQKPLNNTNKKIAVIGAGPAGLTAAYNLALKGHFVEIFDSLSVPGGMMASCIPQYRLPKTLLQDEIDLIKPIVKINCNVCLGKDLLFGKLMEDFDSILIAIGNSKPLYLGIKGEDLEGIIQGIDFLTKINMNEKIC